MKRILSLLALSLIPLSLSAAPHGFLGGQVTQHGVNLTWTASATPGSTVNVYRCTGASCTPTKLTSGVAAAGPYLDSAVTAGAYSYYVTAVVNGAESAPSNTFTLTISPTPPTGLSGAQQ